MARRPDLRNHLPERPRDFSRLLEGENREKWPPGLVPGEDFAKMGIGVSLKGRSSVPGCPEGCRHPVVEIHQGGFWKETGWEVEE